ncbi:MMPL family transporter [Thermomonospora amylolytica]|uniref:MMPL family transporter n=1 Tax=Thermomonospora amylolytica TaxID=1411117 RepID=UPI000E6BF848|nr:MMPL family transporter [Thermomonospora amylolytica]
MSERLARAVGRLGRPVLAVWLVALAAAGIAAMPLADHLSGGGWFAPGSQSEQAAEALRTGFADRGASNLTLVVRDERATAGTAPFARRVGRVFREVGADPRLRVSGSYGYASLSEGARDRFVGRDRRTAVTFLALRLDDGTARRVLPRIQADVADRYERDGLKVSMVSAATLFGEVNTLSAEGLARAETIAFPLIVLILLLLYRGVVAALVSFVVSLTAIVPAFGVLGVLARHVELSIFVQNAALMIGLGVSVDYSLFVISRYTEELARGRDRTAALAATLRTSGETVLFSGVIVVLATAALFLVDLNVIRSIALGIIVAVAFAVLGSVVVLPAVLHLLGERVLRGRLPGRRGPGTAGGGRWASAARQVMRRPVVFLTLSVIALGALAVPALGMRTFTPDVRIVPESSPVRYGYDAIGEQFGTGSAAPIQVVVESRAPLTDPAVADRMLALRDRLAGLPDVVRVDSPVETLRAASPGRPFGALEAAAFARLPEDARETVDHFVSADRRKLVLEVVPDDDAAGERARALLTDVREVIRRAAAPDVRMAAGGETAEGVDADRTIQDALPGVLALMLAVIYLVLLVTFRSVFLPLKAIVMNLLSVGATYGALVLVFQHGYGAALLGVEETGHVQNFVPILLLAILFSLSTDYEVFLLSRVREEHEAGASGTESVAAGLARTAPLISGAAVLMIAVFGAFTFTGIVPIQQLGFGLAVAIALDATVIRLVVVPASMRLMGGWNWWLPGRPRPGRAPAAPAESVKV